MIHSYADTIHISHNVQYMYLLSIKSLEEKYRLWKVYCAVQVARLELFVRFLSQQLTKCQKGIKEKVQALSFDSDLRYTVEIERMLEYSPPPVMGTSLFYWNVSWPKKSKCKFFYARLSGL